MKLSFRQGLVKYADYLNGPPFLQKTSASADTIDLVIGSIPTVFTAAHYGANYLFEETQSITAAWGAGNPNSDNFPFPPGGTYYLYWDIDLVTGLITRGWTSLSVIIAASPPPNPVNNQHWFDTINTRMRVFRKPGASPGVWQDKIRVFAGTYSGGSLITPFPVGSQVGINSGFWGAGNLILGVNNRPLKQSDGTFVTTESSLIIQQTSGQNVKFDMTLVYAKAGEEIPKFYCVSFAPDRRVMLASSNNLNSFVSGIVTDDLHENESGQIITNGVVRNEQWDWQPSEINKPLFVGAAGNLRLQPPGVGVVQQVGFVYEQDSIYFNLFPPVRIRNE